MASCKSCLVSAVGSSSSKLENDFFCMTAICSAVSDELAEDMIYSNKATAAMKPITVPKRSIPIVLIIFAKAAVRDSKILSNPITIDHLS